MKILAFSPFDLETLSGNVITLRRIQERVRSRGHAFEIRAVTLQTTPAEAEAAVREAAPDVLHFYHAVKTGRLLPALRARPSVVTLSGTDVNHCLEDPDCRPVLEAALRGADRLVTYNNSISDRLRKVLPEVLDRLRVIPKGVTLRDAPFDLRGATGLRLADFVFFQAGGIRPVKNNLAAMDALRPLKKDAVLVFAGPILDAPYGHEFAQTLAREPWARHLPHIPTEGMAAAYDAANVVLNTSRSEGLSNALMEAMIRGAAVLAADIPGNRDLIEHGVTGLLYQDLEDLTDRAAHLIRDTDLCRKLGAAARRHATQTFSTDREADALLTAYAETLRARA